MSAGRNGRSKALGDWLADRDAQRLTKRTIDTFAVGWNHGPVNRAFAQAMSGLTSPTAEMVAESACLLLRDDGWVDTLIGGLVGAMRRDPFFNPPFRSLNSGLHRGLLVYEDQHLSLAAGVASIADLASRKRAGQGRGSILFSGEVGVFRFVRAGGARLSFWEAPRIEAGFTAAAAGTCARTGIRAVADGEVLVVDGRHQSFVIEHAASNLVILQASVKPGRAPVSVEYDAETNRYVGCSAADDGASRIQMMATLLRKLDCDAAFPAIADLLDHPHFFVRWHVMRELLGIDAEAAMPYLKRMAARDPHPEVRRTARDLLDRIDSGMARREAA